MSYERRGRRYYEPPSLDPSRIEWMLDWSEMLLPRAMLTTQSAYREALIEYRFLGALLAPYWRENWPDRIEVSRPRVDDAGYDLILEAKSIIRHVQLKASYEKSSTDRQEVHIRLAGKPSGCVIWIVFDSDFYFTQFLWFGGAPGEPLPPIDGFPKGKTKKGDSKGHKKERPDIRVLKKTDFEVLKTIRELTETLFG